MIMMAEWFEIAAKVLAYGAAMVVVGVIGARWLLARMTDPAFGVAESGERLDAVFLSASIVFLTAVLFRAWTHTATAFGIGDAFSVENLHLIALESAWGAGWQQQAAAAVLLVAAGVYQRRVAAPSARAVAATVAVISCFALARTGHAASESFGWALHGTHVLAAGLWVGTLVCVLLVTRERSASPDVQFALARVHLLRAFAPLAAFSVALLAVAGCVAAWIYLGGVANLWHNEYGRVLAVKLTLVVGMGLLGGVNWFRLHRRGDQRPPRTVVLEAGLALLVVVATSVLTETAHP